MSKAYALSAKKKSTASTTGIARGVEVSRSELGAGEEST